jgi:hypothetical protein
MNALYVLDQCQKVPYSWTIDLNGEVTRSWYWKHLISKPYAPSATLQKTMACEFRTKSGVTYILDDDLAHLGKYAWNLNSVGYLRRTIWEPKNTCRFKTLLMHRLIAGATDPKMVVDHINGNKYDNRRENLRIVTQTENLVNRHKVKQGKTSKYRGVHYSPDYTHRLRPWIMQLTRAGKNFNGVYKTEEEAARAYDALLVEHGYEIEHFNFKRET